MVRIGSNNHRTVRGYRSTDRGPKDCGLDAPVRTVPGRDPPEDARRCRTRYALESPAKRTGSRASHRSGRRAPVPCRRHLCGSLLALATMRPARSKPLPVLGHASPSRTCQCHHERDDDEHGAERDARVTTLHVLADHVSRVPGEERRQRVRRLREVQHTSHDRGDSDDEQDYR